MNCYGIEELVFKEMVGFLGYVVTGAFVCALYTVEEVENRDLRFVWVVCLE